MMPLPSAPLTRPRDVLRPVQHPDLSGVLTHFCYRNRPQPSVPPGIQGMTARQRLESILWQGKLWGFTTFSGGVPAVCFTEATLNGLNFMIGRRFYWPWGLVFDRQSIYDGGGGPVWPESAGGRGPRLVTRTFRAPAPDRRRRPAVVVEPSRWTPLLATAPAAAPGVGTC